MSPARTVMIAAGEASGDLYGARLVKEMRSLAPSLEFFGMGGPSMAAQDVRLLFHAKETGAVGFVSEVWRHLKRFYEALTRLKSDIIRQRPSLVILIDFPELNLRLAKAAKRAGVKVFYYVSPQIWGWRTHRARIMRDCVDLLAVALPFEEEFYRKRDARAVFVGHPLMDFLAPVLGDPPTRAELGLKETGNLVALLPGSRKGEVSSMLALLLDAAGILARSMAGISFVLPLAPTVDLADVEKAVLDSGLDVTVLQGKTHEAIKVSDLALAVSGTVTLEAAILGTPAVIVYRVSRLSSMVGRTLIKSHHVGLINILAGETLFPELIQEDAQPVHIAHAALDLLSDPGKMAGLKERLSRTAASLGGPGAARRAARLAVDLMEQKA